MRPRVLLINPGFQQIYKFPKHGSSRLPSLGLLYIAGAIREAGGEVEYLDFEVEDIDIRSYIKGKNFAFIGITGVTPYFPAMYNIAKSIKEVSPNICIIAGGPHATLNYEDVLKYKVFDAVIVGEGEEIVKELIKHYKEKGSFKEIFESHPSIAIRGKSKVKVAYIKDLDTLPMPAYDIVDWEKYSPSIHRDFDKKFICMITVRGCPFKCRYCKTPFDPPFRKMSVKRVLNEINYVVKKLKINYIQFWDDTFTVDKKRTIEISKHLEKLGIKWSINTRPDCIDEEILYYLKKGGNVAIFYGVESASQEILQKLGRNIKPSRVKEIVKLTKDMGIKVTLGCILGLPYDTPDQIMENIKFIKELEPDYVHFSIYSPNPKTYLTTECIEKGLLPPRIDWTKCSQYEGLPLGMPTCNPYLSREELQKLLKYAYSLFPSCASKAENIFPSPNKRVSGSSFQPPSKSLVATSHTRRTLGEGL